MIRARGERLLAVPPLGIINLHPSLLPRCQGRLKRDAGLHGPARPPADPQWRHVRRAIATCRTDSSCRSSVLSPLTASTVVTTPSRR